MLTATVTGDRLIDRRLANLTKKGTKRAITAGIRAGMTPMARALRSGINATSASRKLKRAARKSVAKRFKKNRAANVREAKVGFGVGRGKGKVSAMGKGVGISKQNIHWFVLGTDQRQTKDGQKTGRIEDMFSGLAQAALASSAQPAMDAARAKISQVIAQEARKTA